MGLALVRCPRPHASQHPDVLAHPARPVTGSRLGELPSAWHGSCRVSIVPCPRSTTEGATASMQFVPPRGTSRCCTDRACFPGTAPRCVGRRRPPPDLQSEGLVPARSHVTPCQPPTHGDGITIRPCVRRATGWGRAIPWATPFSSSLTPRRRRPPGSRPVPGSRPPRGRPRSPSRDGLLTRPSRRSSQPFRAQRTFQPMRRVGEALHVRSSVPLVPRAASPAVARPGPPSADQRLSVPRETIAPCTALQTMRRHAG